MNGIPLNIGTLSGIAWSGLKTLIQTAEPYQPTIAAGLIVAKLGWRLYKQKPLNREIVLLDKRINRLTQILRNAPKSMSPERIEAMSDLREELWCERAEKKRQMNYAALTFGQIPSLFFAHPGSNIYQSIHQIVGRGLLMHHTARPVNPRRLTAWDRTKNACSLAGGLISLGGTAASLGRMTGFVAADNRISHIMTYGAIGVHILEGCWMAKDAVRNAYTQYFTRTT